MPKYTVIEVQEVTRLRAWTHEVEADNEAHAIELVRYGESDPASDGDDIGEEALGAVSGCAIMDMSNKPGNYQAARAKAIEDWSNQSK